MREMRIQKIENSESVRVYLKLTNSYGDFKWNAMSIHASREDAIRSIRSMASPTDIQDAPGFYHYEVGH